MVSGHWSDNGRDLRPHLGGLRPPVFDTASATTMCQHGVHIGHAFGIAVISAARAVAAHPATTTRRRSLTSTAIRWPRA